MKRIIGGLCALLLCVLSTGCGSSSKIGVLQFVEHEALNRTYDGFLAALKDNGYSEDDIDFQNAQNDVSNCETIASKMVNDGNQLVFAIATPAAQAIKGKTNDIPIVVSAITDPVSAGIVESNEKPGGNVTGTSDLTPIADQLDLMMEVMPDVKNVAIMYCSSEDNSIYQADIAKKELKKRGLKYVEATVSESNQIQQVAESLVGKVDAIYIPTDNMLAESMASIAMVANENGIPCIVGEKGMCEKGGLLSYSIDYYELGYMAGEQAVKILKGEAVPADMPIAYQSVEECELVVNVSVAEKLGIEIPEAILEKAVTVK